MKIFPAIDIRDGKCVRLLQGDFERETIYNESPVEQAKIFEDDGATNIHIVDLDAAKSGTPVNRKIISEVRSAVSAFIQVGGGVRTEADAQELADIGVDRAVVGTVAAINPEMLEIMSGCISIAAGLDTKQSGLAIEGWKETTDLDLYEKAKELCSIPIEALVVTDISSDGMLVGANLEMISKLLELLGDNTAGNRVELISSGGVADISDLLALKELEVAGKKVAGAIVGKAIYEGVLCLPQALKELS